MLDNGARLSASGGAVRPAPMPQATAAPAPQVSTATAVRLESFEAVVALAGQKRELKLKHTLETSVRLVRFEVGKIEIAVTPHAPADLAGDLSRKLELWTGARWMIAVAREGSAPTIAEARRNAQARLVDDARADPVVAAVMARFPGAEIVDVRVRDGEGAAQGSGVEAPPPPPDDDDDD
jgi:DNA polymerase-3 subunit gamma/tau